MWLLLYSETGRVHCSIMLYTRASPDLSEFGDLFFTGEDAVFKNSQGSAKSTHRPPPQHALLCGVWAILAHTFVS